MPIQQMFLGAGGVGVVEYTASNATNVSLSSVFGSDWAADVEKSYVIPVGVELGATSTSNNALTAESGMGGTLTITVAGTVSGAGGAGGNGGDDGRNQSSVSGSDGSVGGNAIEVLSNNITLVNTGTIRGGGGGGGGGGEGESSWGRNYTWLYRYGGAGGAGGRGEGYNHGSQSGSGGGSSTEAQYGYNTFRGNANGGSGGNGGSYGNSGSSGSSGGNGYTVPGDFPSGFDDNNGPGSGGSGGLAGYSLKKGSGITVSQSGGGTQVGRT